MSAGNNNIQSSFLDGLDDATAAAPAATPAIEVGVPTMGLAYGPLPASLTHSLMVGASRSKESACAAFVGDVVYRAGLDWREQDVAAASYRVVVTENSVLSGVRFDAPIEALNGMALRELLDRILSLDVSLLASAIYATDSFATLKRLVSELGALVQYSRDLKGELQGHVVPSVVVVRLIEQVEACTYLSAESQRANEALPNLLGLRRKVMLLENERNERLVAQASRSGLRGLVSKFFGSR